MPVPPTFDARVVSARELSPSVREIVFARTDGATFDFEPGQWVSLLLPGAEGEIRRAYSIASPPRHDASFEVAVTHVEGGTGSSRLHALVPEDVVRVIGPQGFFTRKPHGGPPSLFIGTGTGVAPLRSMIEAALTAGDGAPVWLLFGGRAEADLLYRAELLELAARSSQLRVEQTLSRGSDAWSGRRGYVQLHARELYEDLARECVAMGAPAPQVFACGLERMVGAVRALFRKEMGLGRELVHTERYD
jgi:CDP-4-dehydro-6-deoxyglucose reductase